MPTYEYECTKGHRFEVEQSMRDPALKRCKVCRSKVQRLISASSFILKGGGWYSDGYGSAKSGSNNASGDGKSEPNSDSKSESKSDSKSESTPAAKPESKAETKPAAKSDPKPSGGSAASAAT